MAETLYRKYRPKTFADVTDQEHIKATLSQEIKSGKLAHAFLFSGPRGVGKTTLARLLAKAVNCEGRKAAGFEPCLKCAACLEIEAGRSLDIVEIDAASQTGVDQVRENIIANAKVATAIRKYKVFIIDEVHMLSTAAFNALLKTLEEPPSKVIFVLATTEMHKVPATIVSRCQRFDFKKIRPAALMARLKLILREEGIAVEEPVLQLVVKNSQGYLRDALSLLGQILSLGVKKVTVEQAGLIMPSVNINQVWELTRLVGQKDLPGALKFIGDLSEGGTDLFQFSNEWVDFLRHIVLAKVNGNWQALGEIATLELADSINKGLQSLALMDTIRLVEEILQRKASIKTSEIPSLPLELAVIAFVSGVTPSGIQNKT